MPASRNLIVQFDRGLDLLASGKRLSDGLSAAVAVGDTLWVAHDETVALERLAALRSGAMLGYGEHRRFDLRPLIGLPSREDAATQRLPEADIEGLAYCDGYLWIAGSHSALRDGPEGRTGRAGIDALARVHRAGNRFLLARLPLGRDDDGAKPVREWTTDAGRVLRAGRLEGGRRNNALSRALRADPHLGDFVRIPSKDNGLDVEGLAAAPGGRLFLGLRGPVLDGWACILELRIAEHPARRDRLTLRPFARDGASPARRAAPYRKHFLDLGGSGVRDLCVVGRDLLILSGPAMRGKGASEVRLWKNALAARTGRLLHADALPTLLELPYRRNKDHAEGIAVVARNGRRARLIVLYDAAGKRPSVPAAASRATLHEVVL